MHGLCRGWLAELAERPVVEHTPRPGPRLTLLAGGWFCIWACRWSKSAACTQGGSQSAGVVPQGA